MNKGGARVNESCSCSCIYERSNQAQSGIYDVLLPNSTRIIRVYCDMNTDGGGWTVFQRRQDGSVDFYREWNDYKRGFGNIGVEFWLGLHYIYELLSLSDSGNELRVDLGDAQGNRAFAHYSNFSLGNESTKYVLGVSGFSGDAGDSLSFEHNGMNFTTKDQDNDLLADNNCATLRHGAWWYNGCLQSNLNGGFYLTSQSAIWWQSWKAEPLKFSEMKFRPKWDSVVNDRLIIYLCMPAFFEVFRLFRL